MGLAGEQVNRPTHTIPTMTACQHVIQDFSSFQAKDLFADLKDAYPFYAPAFVRSLALPRYFSGKPDGDALLRLR